MTLAARPAGSAIIGLIIQSLAARTTPQVSGLGCLLTSSSWSPRTTRSCWVPIVPMSHAEWVAGSLAPVDREHLRHPQRPAWPGTPRRPHPTRSGGPGRATPRFGRGDLVGLEIGAPDKRSLVASDHWDLIHLLADQLGEMEGVTRVDIPGRPSLLLFEVRRRGRGRCWWSGTSATPSTGERAAGGVRLAVTGGTGNRRRRAGPGAAAATPSVALRRLLLVGRPGCSLPGGEVGGSPRRHEAAGASSSVEGRLDRVTSRSWCTTHKAWADPQPRRERTCTSGMAPRSRLPGGRDDCVAR
jgi:hypothetical protein